MALLLAGCGTDTSTPRDGGRAEVERAVRAAGMRVCASERSDPPPAARAQRTYIAAEACPADPDDDVFLDVTEWDDERARDDATSRALATGRRAAHVAAVRTLGLLTIEISGPRSGDLADELLDRLADEGAQ